MSQMFIKTSKQRIEEVEYEVNFTFKPKDGLKLLEDHVSRFLNRLTSYNYMMTINEQLVKHQLRTKFLSEALLIL